MLAVVALATLTACGGSTSPSSRVVVGTLAVAAGGSGSCAFGASGGLACWGLVPSGTPTDTMGIALGATSVTAPVPFTFLAMGKTDLTSTGCGVSDAAQVYCWGALELDGTGQLAFGTGITVLAGASSASSVSIDQGHLCVTRTDHAVRCYGAFSGGGRGTDSVDLSTVNPDASLVANGLSPAQSVFGTAQGRMFGCALRTDSLVACWGTRHRGQLGGAIADSAQNCTGYAPQWCQPGAALVAGGQQYRQLAASFDHACAVRIVGTVDYFRRNIFSSLC